HVTGVQTCALPICKRSKLRSTLLPCVEPSSLGWMPGIASKRSKLRSTLLPCVEPSSLGWMQYILAPCRAELARLNVRHCEQRSKLRSTGFHFIPSNRRLTISTDTTNVGSPLSAQPIRVARGWRQCNALDGANPRRFAIDGRSSPPARLPRLHRAPH